MWCDSTPFSWVQAGTLNPCVFNSAAAVGLLVAAATATVGATRRLRSLTRIGPDRSYMWHLPGSRRPLTAQAIAAIFLAAVHFAALALVLGQKGPHPPLYLKFSEASLVLSWALITVVVLRARRWDDCPRLRVFAWTVAAVYLFSAYSEIEFYLHGMGVSPRERRVRLGAGLAAAAAAAAFLVAELLKPEASPEAGSALQEALLTSQQDGTAAAEMEAGRPPKRERSRSWVSLLGVAARYMWPKGFWLQLRAVICVVLIVSLRLLNLAVPITYKKVIDEFSKLSNQDPPIIVPFVQTFFPWVFTWLALYFLQGGGGGGGAVGLLSNIRSYLWIPIGQASYRRASLDIFSHVINMDHHFHLHRRTGELLRIMDRGTASIQTLLSTMLFQIGPAVFDIAAAAIYLALRLKAWIAAIVFTTLGAYVPMTIILTEWRGSFRRELNQKDNARGARATDALLNYETVKLFGNEGLEEELYADAIDAYQAVDFKLSASMNALNIAQSLVIFTGLAAGMVVCTAGVADGTLTVGDAVLFVTLMQQLYAPLNFFGTYYRMIQTAMLDMEGIFDLLATHPDVQDAPDAKPLALPPGEAAYSVEFKDVSFQYADGAPVLRSVSFQAPAGGTTALVGATGSGKSSLLRMLLRFYDPKAGEVCVGGQNVASVTQASLRAAIAVVPQDTVLFNDTIKYNIRYGRCDATDEEVMAAAEGACIADTIRTRFPHGYDTMVGERGLRLSGGEKQRVAFARALLRNPPILVLDEATSALDSLTERRIQATLASTRAGRTVVVVAHRLSTIMDADRIIVMAGGEVAEVGTHAELVERPGGMYAAMWARQAESASASSVALAGMVEEVDDEGAVIKELVADSSSAD